MNEILQAAARNDVDALVALVRAGADVHAGGKHGNTPLGNASQAGALEALVALLDLGADPNRPINYLSPVDGRLELGFTPLFYADNAQIVDALLTHGANPNATSQDGTTPLMRAAVFGDKDSVIRLIQGGANVNLFRGPDTALSLAKERMSVWANVQPKTEATERAANRYIPVIEVLERAGAV